MLAMHEELDALYAEVVDLSDDEKRRILTKWVEVKSAPRSGRGSLVVLELSPDCTGAGLIKQAQQNLTKVYHPDRFFGRSLGSYKRILADITQRVIEARISLETHDTAMRTYFELATPKSPPPDEPAKPR